MGRSARRLAVSSIVAFTITLGPAAIAGPGGVGNYVPIAIEHGGPDTVIVEEGDHLWSISAGHLEQRLTHRPTNAEIAPYWREVIEINRDHLRSGDPDLIYPGETVLLPDAG